MLGYQKKPVATPGDITRHPPDAGHRHCDVRCAAEACHVANLDLAVGVQTCLYRTARSINFYTPRRNGAVVRKRGDEPDRAVPTHAEITDVVEEYDADLAIGAMRLAEERANECVRAARLIDD